MHPDIIVLKRLHACVHGVIVLKRHEEAMKLTLRSNHRRVRRHQPRARVEPFALVKPQTLRKLRTRLASRPSERPEIARIRLQRLIHQFFSPRVRRMQNRRAPVLLQRVHHSTHPQRRHRASQHIHSRQRFQHHLYVLTPSRRVFAPRRSHQSFDVPTLRRSSLARVHRRLHARVLDRRQAPHVRLELFIERADVVRERRRRRQRAAETRRAFVMMMLVTQTRRRAVARPRRRARDVAAIAAGVVRAVGALARVEDALGARHDDDVAADCDARGVEQWRRATPSRRSAPRRRATTTRHRSRTTSRSPRSRARSRTARARF